MAYSVLGDERRVGATQEDVCMELGQIDWLDGARLVGRGVWLA